MRRTTAHQRSSEPDGILLAIGVCTAAVAGDAANAEHLLRHALAGPDADETLAALITTIAMIGEEAREHGFPLGELLADLGLGVQLLALEETRRPPLDQPHQRG